MTDDPPRPPMPGWAKLLITIFAILFVLGIAFLYMMRSVVEDVDKGLSEDAGSAVQHGSQKLLEGLQSIH